MSVIASANVNGKGRYFDSRLGCAGAGLRGGLEAFLSAAFATAACPFCGCLAEACCLGSAAETLDCGVVLAPDGLPAKRARLAAIAGGSV